jgi:putative peptidoglycan lipid II flippase
VAAVLRALACGLPAFVLVKVFLPAFLAREDMKGPIIAAVLGIAANITVALLLFPSFGSVAAAMGVSASAFVNATALYVMLLRNGRFRPDKLARNRLPRVLLVSVLTGLAIWLLHEFARPWMKANHPFPIRAGVLAALCASGLIVHVALAQLLKAADLLQIRDAVRR